jgi:ferredoxin--NADP+ reductase
MFAMRASYPRRVSVAAMAAKLLEYNATLVERVDLTDALAIFRVAPDKSPAERPWFAAGQYCVLGLNNADTPALGSVRRSMSIASAPEDDGPIEFYIRFVSKPESENPLTHLLWKAKTGDRVYMRAVAAGVFTIKDTIGVDDSRLRVMVAAGTGSAPFLSMLRSELRRNPSVDLSKWVLLHGASYPADLGYRDELLAACEKNRLRYWGTVSRPKEAPDWRGDTGRVEAFFEDARLADLEKRLGLPPGGFTPKNVVIYICGLTGTITGTIIPLVDRGFVPDFKRIREALAVPADVKDSVFYEQYDTEPIINIKDEAVVAPLRARMQAALAKLP